MKYGKRIFILGMISCLLAGCGNAIPELTEEEASLIATYTADVLLENNKESASRLIDTEEETARLNDLAEKVAQLKKAQAVEEEEKQTEEEESSAGKTPIGAAAVSERVENIADFIGLDGFQVSYDGYEIRKSYQAEEGVEWEPVFDADSGKTLLIVKLKVTNISGAPAVADVLSKKMLFSFSGDSTINSMSLMTMLLNDFAYAQDEIDAGESKQYVLITQINENIAEVNSLTMQMKKGDERANVVLQ